jgi:hypothetical protein
MLYFRFGKAFCALFVLWLCVAARPAQAQIDIVNNLSQPNTGEDPINGTLWQADAFQIDSHTYTLSSVVLPLNSTTPGGLVTVDIYSNTGTNQPGVPLFTLGTSSPLTTTLTDIAFNASSSFTLQSNAVYWIVVHTPVGTGYTGPAVGWAATSFTGFTGVGSIPAGSAIATSGSSGSSWTTHPITFGPDQFQVVAATPEPGSLALMAGLGLAGACALRLRRKA